MARLEDDLGSKLYGPFRACCGGFMPTYQTASRRIACAATLFAACAPVLADVTIGNWEDLADGWIDWGTQASIDGNPKYSYTTEGVTNGNKALMITQTGFGQNLAMKLQNNGLTGAFFGHTKFSIDFSVPAQATSGWTEVYQLWINAQNYGFQPQSSTTPVRQFGWGPTGGAAQKTTLTFDYSNLIDGKTGNGEVATKAGWGELIFGTKGSEADHGKGIFDKHRFTDSIPDFC